MRSVDTTRAGPSLAGGTAVLVVAMAAASAGNYALNVILGRWLDPAQFGDVALMVTIMMLTTVAAAGLQIATAAIVARSEGGADPIVARLRRTATQWAIGVAILLAVAAAPLGSVLQVAEPSLLLVMAVGLPLHLRLGVERGRVQGRMALGRLAGSFAGEAAARLGVSVVLVLIGLGEVGATIGLNLGFVAGLATLGRSHPYRVATIPEGHRDELRRTCRHVGVLMLGTAIINNADVIVSKMLLPPAEAGRYAAIALIGRAVFFVAWSFQQAIVPIAARSDQHSRSDLHPTLVVTGMTLLTATALAGGAWVFDDWIVRVAFGPDYAPIANQLGRYATAAALFSAASTVATMDAARGRSYTSIAVLVGAAVQTVAVARAGSSIAAMITAQMWSMALLAATVLAMAAAAHLKGPVLVVDGSPEGIPA